MKPLVIGCLVGVLGFGNLAYGNKYSNEILVNTYTESYQGRSDIAMGEKGNVVITWESLYQDGSLLGVYAQRFDREMNKIGEEIQVNSYTENHQHKPKIAIDKEGNFVITWESQADWRIHARRFDKDGTPIENEFRVSPTESEQRHPRIAMDGQDNFLIAFKYGQYGAAYAQWFNNEGIRIGGEFGIGYDRRIAMDPNGNFVTTGAGGEALYAQRYDRNGKAINDPLLVSLSKSGGRDLEIGQSGVALNDSKFVIVWKDYDDNSYGVYARRFDKDGSKIGEEFQVNTCTEEDQILPDAAMDKEGKFVITWTSWNGSAAEVYAQRFDKDRNKIGNEFRVNNYSLEAIPPPLIEGCPGNSSIVMNYYNSDFVISWEGAGKEDGYGIYAKKFKFYNPADFDHNGVVDFYDFSFFASQWLTREP